LAYDAPVASRQPVTPNRRGARSRERVLDTAERLMAEHGYEAATTARIVEESGIPISSVYHYFGSKDGVLLAVMERGAERFFASLPEIDEPLGPPEEHLRIVLSLVVATLGEHPDFLRLVLVTAIQSRADEHTVVQRMRELALEQLRRQAAIAFAVPADGRAAHRLALFALATIDGGFVAQQADPSVTLADILASLPVALVAVRGTLDD